MFPPQSDFCLLFCANFIDQLSFISTLHPRHFLFHFFKTTIVCLVYMFEPDSICTRKKIKLCIQNPTDNIKVLSFSIKTKSIYYADCHFRCITAYVIFYCCSCEVGLGFCYHFNIQLASSDKS